MQYSCILILHEINFSSGLGSVVGLLKTGSKLLFMFDENGLHYQIKPRCILDFYIHESRQRMGLGMELYQHMLSVSNNFIITSEDLFRLYSTLYFIISRRRI